MPSYRSDFAIVEWNFLCNDKRFYQMELPERFAFLALWVYAVTTRTDWWMPDSWAITLDNVSLHARIPPETVAIMADKCLASGLLSRKRGGAYFLDGVRDRHAKLRGWCPKWGSSRAGGEQRRAQQRREEGAHAEPSGSASQAADAKEQGEPPDHLRPL